MSRGAGVTRCSALVGCSLGMLLAAGPVWAQDAGAEDGVEVVPEGGAELVQEGGAELVQEGGAVGGAELGRPVGERVDLDAAVARAAEVGVDAESARLVLAAARATQAQRRRAWEPNLTLGLSATGSLGRTFSEALGTNVTEPSAQTGARVTSTVPIWSGGERRAERLAADAEVEAAVATVDQARQDLVYTLAGGLLDVEQARADVALAEARVAAEEALASRIAALVEAGARTRADGLSEAAALAEARVAQVEARAALRSAELTVVELLRLEAGKAWEFAAAPAPSLGLGSERDTVQAALSARPALAAAARAVESAEAGVAAARAGGLPSVGFTVGASTSWLSTNGDPLPTQIEQQAAAWAALDVTVPILDRGVTRASVERARLTVRSEVLVSEAAREAVDVAARRAWVNRQAAVEARAAAETRQEAAAAAEGVVRERYDAGAATFAELLAARATLADAERAALAARVAVDRAGWALAWVVGGV